MAWNKAGESQITEKIFKTRFSQTRIPAKPVENEVSYPFPWDQLSFFFGGGERCQNS